MTTPRSIVSVPPTVSTSRQRSATSSDRLAPVAAASTRKHASSGDDSPARRNTRARSAVDGGLMSDCCTRGGVVAAAGLTPSHPHFTPWPSARRRTPWMRRTVAGANPPAPTAGNRLRSMKPRVSLTALGEKSPEACSNHASIS